MMDSLWLEELYILNEMFNSGHDVIGTMFFVPDSRQLS